MCRDADHAHELTLVNDVHNALVAARLRQRFGAQPQIFNKSKAADKNLIVFPPATPAPPGEQLKLTGCLYRTREIQNSQRQRMLGMNLGAGGEFQYLLFRRAVRASDHPLNSRLAV